MLSTLYVKYLRNCCPTPAVRQREPACTHPRHLVHNLVLLRGEEAIEHHTDRHVDVILQHTALRQLACALHVIGKGEALRPMETLLASALTVDAYAMAADAARL